MKKEKVEIPDEVESPLPGDAFIRALGASYLLPTIDPITLDMVKDELPIPYIQINSALNQAFADLVFSNSISSPQNIEAILPDTFQLVQYSRQGVPAADFLSIVQACPFTILEWATFLQTKERVLQKYIASDSALTPSYSERILEIFRLFRRGEAVFGSADEFYAWLKTDVPSLGGIKPISLLDNTFGISIVHDELTRVEHGVLS
ncbi:MAG: antitoxin Xre/MbcA/ParS toxin-binding domain-containing protein [Saprospiraceae bacterium]